MKPTPPGSSPGRACCGVAYDEVLASRVREHARPGLMERTVFGARCWLVNGNMAYGVEGDDLLVRLPDLRGNEAKRALAEDHAHPFDPMKTGMPMKGWLIVHADAVADDHELMQWMERGHAFAATLPPK